VKNTFLFILLSILSLSASAQWNFGLEAGASNYSLLDLYTNKSTRGSGSLQIDEHEDKGKDSLDVALGLSVQYLVNESWQLEMSAWYLGEPRVEGKYTFYFEDGEPTGTTGSIANQFYALAFQLGYRSSLVGFPCVWNAGISRFFERITEDRYVVEVGNSTIRAFDVEEGSSYNFVNHLSMGLTMPFGSPNDSQYLARWQHIQSLYGPVEMFTLGLLF